MANDSKILSTLKLCDNQEIFNQNLILMRNNSSQQN